MIWIPCSVKPKKGEERGGERGESERKKEEEKEGKGKWFGRRRRKGSLLLYYTDFESEETIALN